jgi:hypothetical protein
MTRMRLRELRTEIEKSSKNLFGEKAYPMTSEWIPVTDVLAIVDRIEREWRQEFESIRAEATSCSHQRLKELVQRTVSDLLS